MRQAQAFRGELRADAALPISFTRELFLLDGSDPEICQLILLDEGALSAGPAGARARAPLLLCLDYRKKAPDLGLRGSRGFSVFFLPEAINRILGGCDGCSVNPS